ncbi:hypothetical protein ACPCTO_34950 [Streptomyces olivoreticuli]
MKIFSVSQHELDVICDVCKRPIADKKGYIWIDHNAISRHQEAVRDWEQQAKPSQGALLESSAIRRRPMPVRWSAHHTKCDPAPDALAHSIPAAAMHSWADLASHTAQLLGMQWLGSTDWSEVLQAAAHGAGTRITPASTSAPNP